ncbi:hypothetical protein M758_1G089000 [Ceratodon purpureus]|uniref:Secreted protein n=1 Tax=Ceratodon purpureus TaxID=3225 RepID=A0A8T0J386_CERPU|nr:hypothetical protein KC19_1G094000 [Ceratodon purpureus]KAG0629257.1 hypothetical protein M758_1G089000 [Ceratodon purpureus]
MMLRLDIFLVSLIQLHVKALQCPWILIKTSTSSIAIYIARSRTRLCPNLINTVIIRLPHQPSLFHLP